MELSIKERDRLAVVREVAEGLLRPCSGARKLGLTPRQMRRIMRRFEAEGDAACTHRLRARKSNHTVPEELKAFALERSADPVFADFGPTLLAEHLGRERPGMRINPHTLRRWLIATGQWKLNRRKLHHREWRERRAALGELVQMDTSTHAWFEQRSKDPVVLIAMIDDATNRLLAQFAASDSGAENRALIIQYLTRYGRMRALYTDRASHFSAPARERQLADLPAKGSVIKEALRSLDIELITALSPQAKGRVERLFGTLQDRLLKELRVRNISSITAANHYLSTEFLSVWNSRFTKPPRERADAHRPLQPGTDLLDLFAQSEPRRINPDFTVRFQNLFYQIPEHSASASMPGTTLLISRRLDGRLTFSWRGRRLGLHQLPGLPLSPEKIPSARKARYHAKPAATHPWRNAPSLTRSED